MTTSGTFYVYEHWRLDRDECFYVGKGKGNRAYSTKDRNRHHKAICAKLSREGFAMEVRMVATGLSEKEAFVLEIERIAFWRSAGVDLVNLTNGGEGASGYKPTAKMREYLSLVNTGKKRSEETKRKLSEARKKWDFSEETKKKISNTLRGRPAHFKGRHHTEEAKAILSAKAKLRGPPKLTPETIEKIAQSHRGRKRSAETCAKISAAKAGKPNWAKGKPSKLKGRVLSEETRLKMSEAKRSYWAKIREGA
jgi:hypothetical protein